MLSNVSTKAPRTSIPQLVADYHVEPFFADLEALLEGRWREEPTDVGTAFVAKTIDCSVLTADGPIAVTAGDTVWVIYAGDSIDVGVIFVPKPTPTATQVVVEIIETSNAAAAAREV